jgi:hypothetical protein
MEEVMELHLFHFRRPHGKVNSSPDEPLRHENLIYGTLLVVGLPAVAFGSMYLVHALFKLILG